MSLGSIIVFSPLCGHLGLEKLGHLNTKQRYHVISSLLGVVHQQGEGWAAWPLGLPPQYGPAMEPLVSYPLGQPCDETSLSSSQWEAVGERVGASDATGAMDWGPLCHCRIPSQPGSKPSTSFTSRGTSPRPTTWSSLF